MAQDPEERPYKTYRSSPRGLGARLRGESDAEIEQRAQQRASGRRARQGASAGPDYGQGAADPHLYGPGGSRVAGGARSSGDYGAAGGGGASGGRGPGGGPGLPGVPGAKTARRGFMTAGLFGTAFSPLRILKLLVAAVIGWVLLSAVLFFISASKHAGNVPGGQATLNALSSSGPILTSANNVLVLGLDNRPRTGYSSKEGGANYSEADANTDSIMIWRIGGGTSRRLSIPRDTLVNIHGLGYAKINAAWSYGGPKETIRVVEQLTGVKINHLIVVDLGNFPKFIDDIGGITIRTPRICSEISGGRANGGYTLNLSPGVHHLTGTQALTLARTRENSCNAAYTDLQREAMQQKILNSIRSQLFTLHTFFHLPWAAWDAPSVIQTDMGGLSLMQLFIASELGGSAPTSLLSEQGGYYNGEDVLYPNHANIRRQVHKLMTGN